MFHGVRKARTLVNGVQLSPNLIESQICVIEELMSGHWCDKAYQMDFMNDIHDTLRMLQKAMHHRRTIYIKNMDEDVMYRR